MKPHKHAELIKAWADGAEIERYDHEDKDWLDDEQPIWYEADEYRIKPEPKPEPVKKTMYLYFVGTNQTSPSSAEQKFWISDAPPETYVYRTISQYIGSIEVTK
jgi:hypothetical protein